MFAVRSVIGRVRVPLRCLNTIQHPTTFQLVVKHSKFITHAKGVSTKEEALSFIEEIKDVKATHNCYAYRVGDEERASDDGEVAGTAGKQILSGISNLHHGTYISVSAK